MKITDILNKIVTIKQYSQRTYARKMRGKSESRALKRDEPPEKVTMQQLNDFFQTIERENGAIALRYIKEIFSDIDINSCQESAASSSQLASAPLPPDLGSYRDYYNDALYQKILPLCQLAYLEEENGIAEEHALKLSLIFENEKTVYDYLIKFPEGNDNLVYLVHDACLFDLPPVEGCDFSLWKKIAAKSSNMLNPRFRYLLPSAGAIERINPAGTPRKASTKEIKAKEIELAAVIRAFRSCEQNQIAIDAEEEIAAREKNLVLLSQKKIRLSLELAVLAIGTPLEMASLPVLLAFYEQYRINSNPAHLIMIQNGIGEKGLNLFYTLKGNNDDEALPAITIRGSEIGYPGSYLTKLDTQCEKGAALAACLGKVTNCCQYLGGAGSDCVRHGIESPNGGFYVLFKGDESNPSLDDRVLAQSWVWQSAEGDLCLDSIEAAPAIDKVMASDMYRYLGMMLCEGKERRRVNTGAFSGISKHVALKKYPVANLFAIDYQGYGDSNLQLLLADSVMPYIFYGQGGSDALKTIIGHKTSQCFTNLFALPGDLRNNEDLKKAIAYLINSNQDKDDNSLFQLLLAAAGESDEELHRLIEVNRAYVKFLEKADRNVSLEGLLELLKQGAYINATNESGQSALHLTANNYESLKAILGLYPQEKRFDAVTMTDYEYQPVLLYARQNPESIKAILGLHPQKQLFNVVTNAEILDGVVTANHESLRALFEFIPQAQQRIDAVMLVNFYKESILYLATKNPKSLEVIFEFIPREKLADLFMVPDEHGRRLFHEAASNPDSLKAILELYPQENRLGIVKMEGGRHVRGLTGLYYADNNPESLSLILGLYPPEERFGAVTMTDGFDKTILGRAKDKLESLMAILELMPEDRRFDAIRAANSDGETVLHLVANNTEYLRTILEIYPEDQRLEAIKVTNRFGDTVLHSAAPDPELLKIILGLIPEYQRVEAVNVVGKYSGRLLSLLERNPDAMSAIRNLVPQLREPQKASSSSMTISISPHSFFPGESASSSEPGRDAGRDRLNLNN